jgi:hypothetical protein
MRSAVADVGAQLEHQPRSHALDHRVEDRALLVADVDQEALAPRELVDRPDGCVDVACRRVRDHEARRFLLAAVADLPFA